MHDLLILLWHLIATVARLLGPGGAKSIVAESALLKHQLLILNRGRHRARNLRPMDRLIVGVLALSMRPRRILRSAIVIRPSTILRFHQLLVRHKYRWLFSARRQRKPGPAGPAAELIAAIVKMKRRNPRWGCPRIAMQISDAFGTLINKDIVRRVLARHFKPEHSDEGPSWLTFLGKLTDSLWSVDFFRCESLTLRSHWVMVVMDQHSRRLIGLAAHAGTLYGTAVCRMFNSIIRQKPLPRRISTDNDPLFEFQLWQENPRVLNIEAIKSIPYTPVSHPFVERLIGTLRREFLDQMPFWGTTDLARKLSAMMAFYNEHRCHLSLGGVQPARFGRQRHAQHADLHHFAWQSHCGGLIQTPVPA